MRTSTVIVHAAVVFFTVSTSALATIVTSGGGGLVLIEQGPALGSAPAAAPLNLANGGTAFALDELSGSGHFTAEVNDGFYGNSSSWIGNGATGTSGPYIGINLGASTALASFAFGRSNVLSGDPCGGGNCADRNLGTYTLQFRNDGSIADDAGWTTIGTLAYSTGGPTAPPAGPNLAIAFPDQLTHRRHAYNFTPVSATAMRLIVPGTGAGSGTAVDEIELYSTVQSPSISWDGNDADNFDPTPPATVPINLALASSGAVAFSDGDLGSGHITADLNDGLYGNANSWISDPDVTSFAGINLPDTGRFAVSSIAFGRDNGNGAADDSSAGTDACGGQCDDRFIGTYTLQYSLLIAADASTTATENPNTGWATIGSVRYNGNDDLVLDGAFTGYFRHEFGISLSSLPIAMRAFRILSSSNDAAIDEIEIYGVTIPEPSTLALVACGGLAIVSMRRRYIAR